MALGRPLSPLTLSPSEKQQLLDWTRRPKTAQALALRARIVLLSAAGHNNTEVARRVHVSLATVGKWRQRFVLLRLDGLLDEPRPGTHPGNPTPSRHSLVHALAGSRHRTQPEQHQPHLARFFPAAASQPGLQAEP